MDMAGCLLFGLMVVVFFSPFLWVVWDLVGRPIAVSLGLVERTADDFVVRGWKAERRGQWSDALAEYDTAIRLRRWDEEVEARRTELLHRCPDLAVGAELSERESLATLDPLEVLAHLETKQTSRKLRLLTVACCRRVCHLLTDVRSQLAVEAAENYDDRLLPSAEATAIEMAALMTASVEALGVRAGTQRDPAQDARVAAALSGTWWAGTHFAAEAVIQLTASAVERHEQVMLIRCIFGPRHDTTEVVPSWLTSNVLAIAGQMYGSRDFSLMPILADALQDAGCEGPDILGHCRGPGPHVRGCWVVDLLLGRE